MYSMEEKRLTMTEKRNLIERVTELVNNDILNRDDRRTIYCVCLVACDRERVKIKKEGSDGIS